MEDNEIKKLLFQYNDIILKLHRGGILRTSKIVSDVGEYFVCKKIGLTRADSSVNVGYDAIDDKGLKYEIKTRKATPWNKPTIFPVTERQLKYSDYLIYIEFDKEWNIEKLLKIPSNEVKQNKYNRVPITKALVEKYSIL